MKKLLILLLAPLFSIAQYCDVLEVPPSARRSFSSVTPAPSGYTKTVSICIETDHDMYLYCNSDTNQVKLFVNGWFEQWRKLYLQDSILIRIDSIGYWKTVEPYNWSSSSQVLMDFGARMAATKPTADCNHLVSIKNNGFGGVSYVGAIRQPPYNVSFSHIYTAYYPVPSYSWTVMVLAHETGHMLSSQHTHNCYWDHGNGVIAPIDSCYNCEGGCCTQSATQSGTIMSYCHLTNKGIDFNKGFGTLPLKAIKQYIWNCYTNGLLKMPDAGLCYTPFMTNIITTTTTAYVECGKVGTHYKFRYRVAGGAWNSATASSTLQNHQFSGLQPNKTHFFQVKSKCNGVWSAWSDLYKFKTK